MKAKKSTDKQIKIEGYCIEVEKDGDISISSRETGPHPYVVPDSYVLLTFNDDFGNECYAIVPDDMEV